MVLEEIPQYPLKVTCPTQCLNERSTAVELHAAKKTYESSRGKAPHILNLGNVWRWVVIFMFLAALPPYGLTRRLGGLQNHSGCESQWKIRTPPGNRIPFVQFVGWLLFLSPELFRLFKARQNVCLHVYKAGRWTYGQMWAREQYEVLEPEWEGCNWMPRKPKQFYIHVWLTFQISIAISTMTVVFIIRNNSISR
jgi:hypothetical protein